MERPGNSEGRFAEADLLPISALQHLLFCERQCALIHIEQAWAENRLTVEGRILHERVHEREDETRNDLRISRGLRLRSLALGLVGVADVIEFHLHPDGTWQPYPVEYKRGKPKPDVPDLVQLCAQAFCIEEMLATPVPAGAIFYGTPRRRLNVDLTSGLREQTVEAATRLRRLIESGQTPAAIYETKCENCSLKALCLPQRVGSRRMNVRVYLRERAT